MEKPCSIVISCCNGSSSSLSGLTIDTEKEEAVGRWRNALKEAAALAGMELKNTFNGHEAKFIHQIVQDVSLKLHFINSSIDGKLIGMKNQVKDIVSCLEVDSDDVRIIGIKGIGGGGKTTLARAVYDHISIWFEGKSFVENVREGPKGSGLKELQKQILHDVLNDKKIDVKSTHDGKNMMKRVMGNRKVLLVLDDVDDIGQLEALAGEPTWFKPGSRIIITTRDEKVLVAHGVQGDNIRDVDLLSNKEAISLFSRCAFKKDVPVQEYEELSRKVVHYAAGLPLTIRVLGSFLNDRIELEWEDAIERLKTIPLKETLEKLELSYDGLENDYKEIFLEVACILKGQMKDVAIEILESLGFHAEIGLRVLEQKSLVTTSHRMWLPNQRLWLHDHLEEMGMNIVRRLHPNDPNRHSRLWIRDEIEEILVNGLGTEATKSITLRNTTLCSAVIMKGLRSMKDLRLLYVFGYPDSNIEEVSQYLPDALRSLEWWRYPFRSLPETFLANNLVNLVMDSSNISQLFERGEKKVLNKLRFLDLKYSMLRTFDFGMAPNLERLDLKDCISFVELNMPVECPMLKFLDLSGSKLINLELGLAPHLEELDLEGCYDFVELTMPQECPKLKILKLSSSKLTNLKLGLTPQIETLYLDGCDDFVELNMPNECPMLKYLNLSGSEVTSLNIGLTPHIETLYLKGCNDFVELNMPHECPKLKFLNLSNSKVSSLNLGLIPHIEELNIGGCYYLQDIYVPLGCLKKLVYLNLSGCLRFEGFLFDPIYNLGLPYGDSMTTLELTAKSVDICPLHPDNNFPKFQFECIYHESLHPQSGNIERLISFGLCACTNLWSFSATICSLKHLRKLNLEVKIPEAPKDLGQLESLEELNLSMQDIKHLPDSICMLKHLKFLGLKSCWLLEQLPKDLDKLECLEELHLTDCIVLRSIPNNICNMKRLEYLVLRFCILVEKLPEELGRLECLKELNIEGAGVNHLPQSIFQLKGLRVIGSRWRLESYGFTSLSETGTSRDTASFCYIT